MSSNFTVLYAKAEVNGVGIDVARDKMSNIKFLIASLISVKVKAIT